MKYAMLFLMLAACTIHGAVPGVSEPVRVGALAPLTGSLSYFGEEMRKGFDLAAEEINEQGGVNGKLLQLVYEDTKCDITPTVTALNKLRHIDDVAAFLGPFCGSSIEITAKFAEKENLIGITSETNFGKLGPTYFSTKSLLEKQMRTLAEHAYKAGMRTVGIIYFDNLYGVKNKEHFAHYFTNQGGSIVGTESFLPWENPDYRTMITKMKNADAIFIVWGSAGEVINQIRELGSKATILGIEGIDNPDTLRIAENNAEGIVSAKEEKGTDAVFASRWEARYHEEPTMWARDAYDSAHLMAHLFNACGSEETECAADRMINLKNYQSVAGPITFNPQTWDTGKDYYITTVRDGQAVRS
ncbi:MAG: penicillin-binding protein activator [Candidatus Woesearchaeota archaeon]|jgi:branched-chain amino acid transport system substrate-binding protein|nr:penicillin-binding protein activator [Candidatus Woesearchaeota archaeon]MDP7182199.1 penicillin-binding protein activator [Candidatus Woesearchaeota archaeon]MDP7199085.1 penicillin-binding protein activator [Candidatus Woesearchaeota archaeon]MDP7467795.1 penicillin-binding protein activator [Candidatus Woesearchaeota archaeon]MDP7646498.1 penicillin-binding protein activator [Candidatus Woesearchaeota archaeon]